jgi:HTH-type transcriptional regulator / antitoxin HigA
MNMDIHPIRSEDDYRAAMREISAFFDNEPELGTQEGDRFDICWTVVWSSAEKSSPSPGEHSS